MDFDPASRLLCMPGSCGPLLLILLVFAGKFAMNTLLALQPTRAADMLFMACAGVLGGLCCGAFLTPARRALRLVRPAELGV